MRPPLSVVVAWGPAADQSKISGSVTKVAEPPGKVGTKVKETRQFKADMPIKWFWQKAKPIGTLTPADKTAVLKQVHGIYDAFVAKDVDRYHKSGMQLYQDMATYLGISLQQVMAPEKQGLSRMFQADGYKAKMLKDADLKVEAFGPFVVVSPAKPSQDAVIQISTSGPMSFKVRQLAFCKVAGEWWRAG